MNDKQTGKEKGFKVHKLPTRLYDQAVFYKESGEIEGFTKVNNRINAIHHGERRNN